MFGSEMIEGSPVATVTFTLTDGVLGDDTGVDGVIVDMGGPALQTIFTEGIPALSPLGDVALLAGIAALGLAALRRRRSS